MRALIIPLLAIGVLTACSGTNHDAPNPTWDIVLNWHRVETPPSVVTEYFACFGTDGILLDQADGNASVTPNDPMCPKGGESWTKAVRTGQSPAEILGKFQGPPDD